MQTRIATYRPALSIASRLEFLSMQCICRVAPLARGCMRAAELDYNDNPITASKIQVQL